ncbi:hypothetical protein MHU86_15291 [Fragilaria crotonensis]|nr:hypothetical protein MHU86_15291 [Fragilaria crotonensis]
MVNPALTHLPPTEANCPPTHCVKPTKHMANYVAADGDIAAPFDALKNAALPFKKHPSYYAATNTLLPLLLLNLTPTGPRRAPSKLQAIFSTPKRP